MKKESTKKRTFKAHNMYNLKTGKVARAGSYAKHLALKKKGYGHTKSRGG